MLVIFIEADGLIDSCCVFLKVRNVNTSLCFDTIGKRERPQFELYVYPCTRQSSHQVSLKKTSDKCREVFLFIFKMFSFSNKNELRREDKCGYVVLKPTGSTINMTQCSESEDQKWYHNAVFTCKFQFLFIIVYLRNHFF